MYLPLEKGNGQSFEQIWLKLNKWFWRRLLNNFNVYQLFCYYLPLERGVTLHLNKLDFPSPKDALCLV